MAKKLNKIFIIIIAIIVTSIITTVAFGYDDKTTHPTLTKAAVDVYNNNSTNKIETIELNILFKVQLTKTLTLDIFITSMIPLIQVILA